MLPNPVRTSKASLGFPEIILRYPPLIFAQAFSNNMTQISFSCGLAKQHFGLLELDNLTGIKSSTITI